EAIRCTVTGVDVHTIDLHPELGWSGPDQRTHAAGADRNSGFTARSGLVVDQVGTGDYFPQIGFGGGQVKVRVTCYSGQPSSASESAASHTVYVIVTPGHCILD